MLTKKQVEDNLRKVHDPELGVSIVDLGLIYDIRVKKGDVFILMTLTFPGCPLGVTIHNDINEKLKTLEGVKSIRVEVTFNPPWDLNKINPEVRFDLGV